MKRTCALALFFTVAMPLLDTLHVLFWLGIGRILHVLGIPIVFVVH